MRLDPIAVAADPNCPEGARHARRPAGRSDARDRALPRATHPIAALGPVMTLRHSERLGPAARLRNSREFVAVQTGGTLFRGRCALLLVLARPGDATRVGFVASKRGVGGAVQRNRARRRLREIVRRIWSRVATQGWWFVFVASRAALDASHERLATEVENLLSSAGILSASGAEH